MKTHKFPKEILLGEGRILKICKVGPDEFYIQVLKYGYDMDDIYIKDDKFCMR